MLSSICLAPSIKKRIIYTPPFLVDYRIYERKEKQREYIYIYSPYYIPPFFEKRKRQTKKEIFVVKLSVFKNCDDQ